MITSSTDRFNAVAPRGRTRVAFTSMVLLFTWLGDEFDHDPFLWYQTDIAGVPLQYLVIGAMSLLGLTLFDRSGSVPLIPAMRSSGLWNWTVLTVAAVFVAVVYGIVSGSTELFADWRNLIVFALVAIVTAKWGLRYQNPTVMIEDLAIGVGIASLVAMVSWMLGGGTALLGVSVPVFDGHKLFMAVFASGVGAASVVTRRFEPRIRTIFMTTTMLAASLLVIASFRRSFWGAWVLVMVGVLIWATHQKILTSKRATQLGLVGLALTLAAITTIGFEAVTARLASFLPGSDNVFSATNADHVNDVIQALQVISGNPITGLGIGEFYDSPLIAQWKIESFEVHNSIVHVWLKFGLLGVLAFIGFHTRFILALFKSSRRTARPALAATAIFLIAEAVAQMVGTWSYGSVQMSVFHGVLLGTLISAITRDLRADAVQSERVAVTM